MNVPVEPQTFKQLEISPASQEDQEVLQEQPQNNSDVLDVLPRELPRKKPQLNVTHRRSGVKKFGQLQKKIKKVITPTKLNVYPIDGKQQFGDKAICRLCRKSTADANNQGTETTEVAQNFKKKKPKSQLNLYVVSCNRCHFKYHPECVNCSEGKEPKSEPGAKWQCQKCNERVLLKNKQGPSKKKKKQVKGEISLKGKRIKKMPTEADMRQRNLQSFVKQSEEIKKKTAEFAVKYPQYVSEGQIVFPIHDEYLNAYQSIFSNNTNAKKCDQKQSLKKPSPTEDPLIPQEAFGDILFMWDTYNKYASIIKDIINKYESENDAETKTQMFNVGTFYHFKDTQTHLYLFSRDDIYLAIKNGESSDQLHSLILFFLCFYLKQIFEDIENETYNLKLANKGPYWQLMNYLWHCDREAYYNIIHDQIYELPQMLVTYGFFSDVENTTAFQNLQGCSEQQRRKALLILSEGLIDLKRTQNLIQFRTEQILCSNRVKNQLSLDIKNLRSQMAETQDQQKKFEVEYQQAKKQQETADLPRQETMKLQKIIDSSQREIYKLKNQFNKDSKDIEKMKEEFKKLQDEVKITMMPQLLLNTSVFLGCDEKYSHYYYFLYDIEKIFVSQNLTSLDDDESERRWGYYHTQLQIESLLRSLQIKGVRENQLKQNIEELQKSELLTFEAKIIEEQDVSEIKQIEKPKQFKPPQEIPLNVQLLYVEKEFSDFLGSRESRWTNPENRYEFRRKLETNDPKVVASQAEYLIDHTMIQEKLEIKSEEEEMEIEKIEENKKKQEEKDQLKERQKKRRVVEDDSSDLVQDEEEVVEQINLLDVYEKMNQDRIKVRKLPLKLFGNHNENLKIQMLESLKQIKENGDSNHLLQVVISTLYRAVTDYISRKREKMNERQNNFKGVSQPVIQIAQQQQQQLQQQQLIKQQEIQQQLIIQQIIDETPRVSKNLRNRQRSRNTQFEEDDNQWEDACKICGSRGKVICCDTCPLVYHPKCLGLKQVPQGKWSCIRCLSKFEAQIKTRATMKKLGNLG